MQLSLGFKKYASNTGFLFFEKFFRMAVTFFIWPMVIRYLGPEQYGTFSFALSIIFMLNVFSDLNLESIVTRDLINRGTEKDSILGAAFLLKLAGSFFAVILILMLSYFVPIDFDAKRITLLMSVSLVFQSLTFIDYFFQSQVISKYTVYAQVSALVASSLLYLLFIYWKLPLVYFAFVIVVEAALTAAGSLFFFLRAKQKILLGRIRFSIMKNLLKDAYPLILASVAIAVYMRIDQIMLKSMLGSAALGYYAAAVRLSEVFYFLPVVLTGSLFPAIVNAKLKDKSLYEKRLQALLWVLLWFSFFLACATTLGAPLLINILYGKEYGPAASVLSIHIWATIFVFWGVLRSKWAINENLQFYIMVYTIVGALANIILNIFLIPRLGIQGAAIATVVSQFFAAVLSNLFNVKTREMFYLQMRTFAISPVYFRNVLAAELGIFKKP